MTDGSGTTNAAGALTRYLAAARARNASDLHLAAGAIPTIRVEGRLERLATPALTAAAANALAAEACARSGAGADADAHLDRDFCLDDTEHGRFRVNHHGQARGRGLSLKCISKSVPDLDSLGLPDSLQGLVYYRTGLVLATGPANCGKSSTLAALIAGINATRREHIITVEDPIEFVFASDRCNITQREVGPHTKTFSSALRASLREDPDVIYISELRDRETIRTAIVAAETGHLVFGTLHTRDAASTIHRLVDVFPADEQDQARAMLAASLRTVISQRLLPRQGGGRRVPAYEILHITPAVANLVRDGRTHQLASQLQLGRRLGMVDLDTRLQELVEQGLVTTDVAAAHAHNPRRFGKGART